MSASDEDENILRLWDFWSGQMIGTFQGHTARVMAVEIMPNGHRAVSASLDGTLRLWDLESGQMIRTFQGHSAEVWAMAITPDGHRTVSASRDKTVRLWDMENDQEIAIFTGEGPMETCAVSSDGQTIVVIETSGQAHFLRPVESDKTKPAIDDTKIQILQQKEQATSGERHPKWLLSHANPPTLVSSDR
jgi:WD40 repeat protein